ncbi:MAG: Histidine kinase protein [Patescibacteria group bacterium]|nr:Histidine kinase protein [Patescibacteria group bacterium]
MKIVNDLNLKKQAEELGISVWQTPGFLFLILGAVAITVMSATFYLSQNYDSPEILVLSESAVSIVILIVGNSVIGIFEQMAKVNKLKSEFVSVASHQLRTPLSAIRWETELLLSKLKKGLSDKQVKNIESISLLSARMTRLVNDLLDVTRIDQKRLLLKKEPVNISILAEEAIAEATSLAKSRNVEIAFTPKKNLPKVIGDREKIKMVIENLVGNSIKYTTNRGKIEIKVCKKDNYIFFSIKDNGVGIPEEQQNRVFDKFFRSDNCVKYQTDGTGLGLYIAKSIVDQSGGEMWFNSVENLGSIFNFKLPVK